MKTAIVFAMLLSLPAFAKRGLSIVKNQPYIDAIMRASSSDVAVSCRNGLSVTIRHNTAFIGDQAFNWTAGATLSSDEAGTMILNLYPRAASNLTYYQLNSICTYADYPAKIAAYRGPAKPVHYPGACNPWVNCH
jgi:hypothetical protein